MLQYHYIILQIIQHDSINSAKYKEQEGALQKHPGVWMRVSFI